MTFGERIISLRKKLKWSQDELAKKIGTSAPIIGRYERNEIKPSIETAKNIADSLNVTLDYLLGGSNSAVLDKELLKRLEDIESLSQEDKDKIYYFIDMAIRDAKARQAYKE
ncbi:Putative PBSX repressor [Salinivirga cyanobacteriivorans]|uniref:PBSX repressor n=1 Tax=Salinivirga cyanobacteriivorans TaxID=1307839 RepID=A0A0S2HUP5_9BACT|nr:helix-turn-helix transcriptional regulator [Salinivirga cyanobacteriivorans]ALO13776.1 Putative PBSX repressor [Salinivirga cyanobacteriivorans]ALO13789.1 Putative PBSX repressor [Salinivirga cyanobacteriivorans]